MVYRIYNAEDVNKIEQFLEQEHIKCEKEHYALDLVFKDDVESLIESCDEYDTMDKEVLDEASKYAIDKMWEKYEWCDYNEALMFYFEQFFEEDDE